MTPYGYEDFWTNGYRSINVSYYKCDIDTDQTFYNQKITRIYGQHSKTGHSDADVKLISNYEYHALQTFSSVFCQKFPNLEVISITNAILESIDSLSNCKNLNYLILDANQIQELPETMLIENSKLIFFWIYENQLTTLPENLFLNQKELEQLDLSDNLINFLPSNIFRPLVKLDVLCLHKNKLESINPGWFVNLQNLKWLRLDRNQIVEIPSKCFASLINLKRLSLNENRIKALNSDDFDGLRTLELVDLHSNDISDLPVDVFAPLICLYGLDLGGNKLTTIHSDSFGMNYELIRVNLQENRINAIEPKFIENTEVSTLNMTNNICSESLFTTRNEIIPFLTKCFDNYQPRIQPQTKTTTILTTKQPTTQTTKQIIQCGKSKSGLGNIIGGTQINSGDYPW